MSVTLDDVQHAVRELGIAGRPLGIHSSLRSFGWIEGGPATVIDGLLNEGCTVMVPTFSWGFSVPPPPNMRPQRNGWDYDTFPGPTSGIGRIYTPDSAEIDDDMGAIPAALVARPGRVRGDHPICSFSAVGPVARGLVNRQEPTRVYAPLEALAEHDGLVVLMGVGLEAMTLIHLAERAAGRRLFRRWANMPDGNPAEVEAGGCSEGFGNFEPVVAPLAREARVGQSRWRVFPARSTLERLAEAIRENARLTHCGDPGCERCNDAIAGGPVSV